MAFANTDRLVSAAEGGEVIQWDIDVRSWMKKACRIANRNLTRDEWAAYIGSLAPYHVTCPDAASADSGHDQAR